MLGSGEGCVEQEADGSWVTGRREGAEADSSCRACGDRVIHLKVWPEPGPGVLSGLGQAKPFRETNFSGAAGLKPGLPVL